MLNYKGQNDLKTFKTEFPDNKCKFLTKQLANLSECFNSLDEYKKPVDNLKKENFFSQLKNDYQSDKEIERKKIIKKFNFRNGEELTQLYLRNNVLLLTCVFEKVIKVSVNEFRINPLYCVSLPGYTWKCRLKYAAVNLQTLQDKHSILTLENKIRGGISSIMGDRYVKSYENKQIL